MNAEQKQRAAELLAAWRATAYALHGDRMANLLQELVDALEAEPVARVTGYCAGYLSVATVDGRVLPTGTALYTAPPAPSVPEVATATNPSQISSFTEPGAWRYVIPGRRRTEKFDSSRVGDYNQGWNDCRNITEKALNDLEKRK